MGHTRSCSRNLAKEDSARHRSASQLAKSAPIYIAVGNDNVHHVYGGIEKFQVVDLGEAQFPGSSFSVRISRRPLTPMVSPA